MRVVGIAGAIGSGKSELSRALARELDAERLSFGDFVRRKAEARGVEPTRENLQQLGEQLIDELGAPEFVRRVLTARPPADLLVDGVRHLAVDEALRKIAAQYVLVFVTVDDDTRRRRLAEREGHDVDLAALDQHSTEREVPLLRERGDRGRRHGQRGGRRRRPRTVELVAHSPISASAARRCESAANRIAEPCTPRGD